MRCTWSTPIGAVLVASAAAADRHDRRARARCEALHLVALRVRSCSPRVVMVDAAARAARPITSWVEALFVADIRRS